MTGKSMIEVAPMPERLAPSSVDLRPLALVAFKSLYNESPEFVDMLSGYDKGTYKISKDADNFIAALAFRDFCRNGGGPTADVASLSDKDLFVLFNWLRKQTVTSPSSRIAAAKKAARNVDE